MRALVTGASGQLGQALLGLLGEQVVWSGGREELDVRDQDAITRVVSQGRPDVVFNAAAYNNVDGAESDAAQALSTNAHGPLLLARACKQAGALLVHVSSDYVFDGTAGRPLTEEDTPRPLSVYGVSKLAGELMVAASGAPYLLVRTSGVFGAGGSRVKGGSFVERMLARGRAGEALRVVSDQVFSPTYAPDLASALLALVETGVRGLFHVVNEGECSWHALAVAALAEAGLGVAVEAIRSDELKSPARRPRSSVLAMGRYRSLGLTPLRPWRAALAEFLRA